MKKNDFELVALDDLRIGLFVELDVGWMAHPFPSGSFKISSAKQIEALRALGQERIRVNTAKSDPPAELQIPSHTTSATSPTELAQKQAALAAAQSQKQRRSELLAHQQNQLIVCERRFSETVRQYRKTLELVQVRPQEAGQECMTMVGGLVGEMMVEGESAIRLLTEAAGDKSSMHPVNVTIVSLLLGKAMGMPQAELVDLGLAAFLHDIGKIELPDRVRWHEDSFSTAESRLYQEHVALGVHLAKNMALPASAILAIAQHHELADGSGFPQRTKADAMGRRSHILALVNRYDNLCNPSRSASALTPHEALSLIFAQLKSRFDSATLSAFIRMMGVYPPGSVVQLVDERYALVVSVNSTRPLKPRVVVHEPGIPKHEAIILDLEHAPNLGIRRSLKPMNLPPPALDYLSPRQRICYFFERVADPQMREAVA